MSQLREKQKKTKDNSFVWTDDEVLLLLKVTLDYKTAKTMENIDWESCQTKHLVRDHAIRLESSPSSIEHTTFLLAAILENLAGKKTGSDTVTSAYTKIYGYTAYTEISTLESVYGGHVWMLGVSA